MNRDRNICIIYAEGKIFRVVSSQNGHLWVSRTRVICELVLKMVDCIQAQRVYSSNALFFAFFEMIFNRDRRDRLCQRSPGVAKIENRREW